jgi:DNA gyrase subunit A
MNDLTEPALHEITPVTIEDEMRRSYLDYAMSVIVSRALPDVRDGLKPVHRRILFAMKDGGYDSNKPTKKSSRVVGDVMGKYHPHGDSSIYEAMVRMAQDFSMRLPLIHGQGNFGSMDGDKAAAMRYTEARLARAAEALLEDIDKETVDFQANYDESLLEPTVLPARFPNLLVNGAGGIAVGMATNVPPHNLGEVLDACCAYLDNSDISTEELIELVPGPDFPTGALIVGRSGIRAAYHTGRGSVMMRGRTSIEDIRKDRLAIIIHEVPYQVNKAKLMERIAECVAEKLIEGISELRDESDRDGVRMVIELKRDATPEVVLAQLYRFTPLQTSFGVNSLALNNGRPEMMGLREIIKAFVEFRDEVITKRTIFELNKARERAHVMVGLAVAVANIDEVIRVIRQAPDPQSAREALCARVWDAADVAPLIRMVDDPNGVLLEGDGYRMTEGQARAILELRLHRLTGLEREKIAQDLSEIVAQIADLLDILSSRERLFSVMREEFQQIREQFATPRRTEIIDVDFETDIEDLIEREDMVVTVSHAGYIKRVPLTTYRAQRRGGKGRAGMATREEDFVSDLFVANTHTALLFFSTRGMVYKMKTYRLPLASPQARGKALVNLLPLEQGETISTIMPLPDDEAAAQAMYVMFATRVGTVRRNLLSDFVDVRAGGKIAMKLEEEGDRLISVQICRDDQDLLLATRSGKSIRFAVGDVRVFSGRTSTGVRGIRLAESGDEVVSMAILNHVEAGPEERAAYLRMKRQDDDANLAPTIDPDIEGVPVAALAPERFDELAAAEQYLLTITENGFGKRSSAYEYRLTGRGGQGIWNIDASAKVGDVVASFPVGAGDQAMLVTNGGQVIRVPVDQVRLAGRKTQGVTVFRVGEGERVVSVAHLDVEAVGEDAAAPGESEPSGPVDPVA